MDALGMSLWDVDGRERVEKLQWKTAQDLLRLGHVVVIEWGTWARSERDVLRLGARALGAAVELHALDAPPDVLFERMKERKMEPPASFADLLAWDASFERPSPEELALFDSPYERALLTSE